MPNPVTCMSYFFLWNTKDDILKKVDVQTTLAPTDKLDNIMFKIADESHSIMILSVNYSSVY